LDEAFDGWGDEAFFRWKYSDNPQGDSLHMIGYDEGAPIATVGFWRNGPPGIRAYQCVDAAVRPTHQRRGIYQIALNSCSERLVDSYIYTFTSDDSRPSMEKVGWNLRRTIPLKFHLASIVLRKYRTLDVMPENYAQWRFVDHPTKQYYVYRWYDMTFLLDKRREHIYAVGGVVSNDLDLEEVRPLFLCSYDFPDLMLKIPRPRYYLIDNPCHVSYEDYIPGHHSDTF